MLASQGSSDCFSSIHTFLEKQNVKRSIEHEFGYGRPRVPVEGKQPGDEESIEIQIVQPAKPSQPLLKAEIFSMPRENEQTRETFRADEEQLRSGGSHLENPAYPQGTSPHKTPGFSEPTLRWRHEQSDTGKHSRVNSWTNEREAGRSTISRETLEHKRDPSTTKEELEKSKELKFTTMAKELNQGYASAQRLAEQQKNVEYYMQRLHAMIEKE